MAIKWTRMWFPIVPLTCILITCGGDIMSNEKEYLMKIPDFQGQLSEKTSLAVDQVVKTYQNMVADVIGQLRNGKLSNEGKVYAIYLLGELRAATAVTILIENIDLKASKVDPKGGIGRWGMYPAQEALSKVGTPAVNMIIDKLPNEKNELRRKLMCFVISDVEGKSFGRMLIKHKYDEESDASKKANLELALKFFNGE